MMKRFVKWIMIILSLLVLVYGVVYLPEYIAERYDNSYVNGYQLYRQETSATVNTNLSIEEKLRILCSYPEEQNVIDIMTKENVFELKKEDEGLLTKLKQEIRELEQRTLVPTFSNLIDFEKDYLSAKLEAVTVTGSPGKILYLWVIQFLPTENGGEYFFWVDADTYQIYAVSMVGEVPAYEYSEDVTKKWGTGVRKLTLEWTNAYVDYLWEEGAQDNVADEPENQGDSIEVRVLTVDHNTNPKDVGFDLFAHIENVGIVECRTYYGEEWNYEYCNFFFGFQNFLQSASYYNSIYGLDSNSSSTLDKY